MVNFKFNNGMRLRPASAKDEPFISNLFRSTRQAILAADAQRDYLEMIVEGQQQLQINSYQESFPNAMIFIAELHQQKIGRVIVDLGHNVAHLIDLMLITSVRGKGYGKSIILALQEAARKNFLPMTLVVEQHNIAAKQLYLSLGFKTESIKPPSELMVWYPEVNKRHTKT